jgi:predicted phage terminase large subunit-like protein
LLEFSIEYFSEARNPENDGNWGGFDITNVDEAANFHVELTDMMNEVSTDRPNAKVAAAIARSHGKSTYLSRAFPISEVLYRKRRYIITISETPTVAKANMEWIRNQLKYNKKLRDDFGPLLSPKDQANITDNGEEFIAWHYDGDTRKQIALVQAASTGQALRGRNWNGTRPDLIICDDLEDARPGGNASTAEQRTKLRQWFFSTVMPLGDPKGERTAFVIMGTTVNKFALLMHILYERADFKTKVYRAIIEPPEREDLWEECRLIYIDRDNPNRAVDARQFYEDNKAEMDRGARVLWPDVQPLWKLMTWKWDNGSLAFNTEYQNNPIDQENMIFNPETFTYWSDNHPGMEFPHSLYTISFGVDVAMGKTRGDYSALAVTARHKENGSIYVIDSFVERIKPDGFINVIVDKTKKWQPDIIAAEAQAAQEFIVDTLKQQLIAEGYPANTRVKKIYQRARKELRIEAMLPDIENGTIKFHRKHSLLLEQFETYGQGGADDAPDSLEMSVSASKTRSNVIQTSAKRTR